MLFRSRDCPRTHSFAGSENIREHFYHGTSPGCEFRLLGMVKQLPTNISQAWRLLFIGFHILKLKYFSFRSCQHFYSLPPFAFPCLSSSLLNQSQASCQSREHSPHARLVVSGLQPAPRPCPLHGTGFKPDTTRTRFARKDIAG